MRIALVNNFFVPRPSGSAHLTEGLAREFAAAGHDVLVVTASYGDAPDDEWRDGYHVVRLKSRSLPRIRLAMNYDIKFAASPSNWRRLKRLLDDFAPDVLHQHGQFFDITWMSSLWARRRRIPVALTVHTPLVHTQPVYGAILWLGDMVLARPFIALDKPTVVVFDKWIKGYVQRRYRIPEDRLASIVVGIDADRFGTVDPSVIRDELHLRDRPVVLSLGHVIPLRNRLTLIRALPRLLERHPETAVVVVGDVNDETFLHLAAELGVRDSLIVTGSVPKEKIPYFVAACNLETHDHQGLGLGTTTLEVMASGKPVVAAADEDNFAGIQLRSWENTVLIGREDHRALAEAMITLLDQPVLAERIGKAQRQVIEEHFTIGTVARNHLKLYEDLVAARR
jgi:1,2-diacylglycerol 3-alpha-glucosyltransferase